MKALLFALTISMMIPMTTNAQKTDTDSLWVQVKEAENEDLPQTEQKLLRQIASIAEQNGDYAMLLKAELQEARSLCSVSPDSLAPAVERLKEREQQARDSVLKAVYCTVLGYVYRSNSILDEDNYWQISADYYAKALEHPHLLAATSSGVYSTIINRGNDSRIFGDDLLSVIGYEAGRYDVLRDYYASAGNRKAELMATLQLFRQQRPSEMQSIADSEYLQRIDSLIEHFGDLEECGEAAIERYSFMNGFTNATAEQKMTFLDEALRRWGSWQRISLLKNSREELLALQFHATMGRNVQIPGQWQTMSLTAMRGITKLTMRIYSVDGDGTFTYDPNSEEDYENHIKKRLTLQPELTKTLELGVHKGYELFDDSLQVPPLPIGLYMIEIESTPSTKISRQLLYVSNIKLITQNMPEKKLRIVVVDATTGQPLEKAKLELTSNTGYYSQQESYKFTTDEKGEYIYTRRKDEKDCNIYVTTDKDVYCPRIFSIGGNFSYYESKATGSYAKVYTDRQMYRPGQMVHAAAIFYNRFERINFNVVEGKEVTMKLLDANGKMVAEKKVVTDEYGTCNADFKLPSSGLAGQYSVTANDYSEYFRVEEYKRPTFEVDIPTISRTYADGDTVDVVGTARSYAGVSVQGAKVKYKVVRRRAFWWMTYYSYWNQAYIGQDSEDIVLAEGETVTADDGTFKVGVPIVVPKTRYTMFYNFVVTADVTDQAGETHAGSLSLPMGNRPKAFSIDMPSKVLREEGGKLTFYLRNAAGTNINESVKYRFDNSGQWLTAETGVAVTIADMATGQHTVDAVCQGETLKQTFTVFSLDDQHPAETTDDWFYVSSKTFPNDGTPVTLQVGASDDNLHVVYAIYSGKKVIESGSADMSNALINSKLTYSEEYGDGLFASFAWVKNGVVHTHHATIERPLPDTRLRMQWATFRDRLKPGQQEEWTLTVLTPDGKPAQAQLMATLFDKSLDQLEEHKWVMKPYLSLSTPYTTWRYESWQYLRWQGYLHFSTTPVHPLDFSEFNHQLYPSRWMPRRNVRMFSRAKGAANVMVEEEILPMAKMTDEIVENVVVSRQVATNDALEESVSEDVEKEQQTDALRQNMDETAFFVSQLVTDEMGRVAIKFTLPEALTTWRFIGAAHDKQMFCGMIEGEAVASKDVMIQPNMPRFVRFGDKAVITARIFNTSQDAVSGTAKLTLLDPQDESIVVVNQQEVSIAAGSTTTAQFTIDSDALPEGLSMLIARVSVAGQTFSDGEQHYLPVMPNREHVIVTVPFTQHNPGTKNIDLTAIVPQGATQTKITAEYTNNPAWMMIQALPAIGHPHDDCAICQAGSLYSNSIGKAIVEQNPQTAEVFEQWTEEQGNETSLMSSLAKNQELKDLVLDETPWVADADGENEQKTKLAEFFNNELITQRLQSALEKLTKMQNSDGSWSWWPDMKGSWYMTVSISQMMVRLNTQLNAPKPENASEKSQLSSLLSPVSSLLDRSFRFMGNETVKMVEEMKKDEKKGIIPVFPSQTVLDWLYICAMDGRSLPKKVREANDYLIELLKKETKNQSIYGKAMTAIVLAPNNSKMAKQYVKSLKEYTVCTEEAGRYYDTPRALYSWRDYRIPTQVAAIEAIQMLTPNDTETINEMLRWLLHEKRTQAWDTPLSTIDAIFAFLNGRQQVLQPQEETTLSVDGNRLDTPKATAGLGYVKTVITTPEDSASTPKTFTATKTSKGTSWGAIYAQFMQQSTDISKHSSGFTVTREILANPASPDSPVNILQPGDMLKVGDRVKVRITIVADRDYDFVQVIDKRAACMEPVDQKSGYHWARGLYAEGYYCTPRDGSTNFYFDRIAKGKHVVETEYYIDRPGRYATGTCTVSCAYSPEFRATTPATTVNVE